MLSNINSEKKVLSYLFSDKKYLSRLREEYFSDNKNKIIFQAMKKHNCNLELILLENNFLEKDLESIILNKTSYSSIDNHIDVLKKFNKQRKILEIANNIINKNGDIELDVVNEISEVVIKETDNKSIESLFEVGNKWLNKKEKEEVIKYNMELSKYLTLAKGDFIVIGARPSIGKTAFQLQLALNIAYNNHKVLCFSLEMKNEQLFQRVLSNVSNTALNEIRDKKFSEVKEKELKTKLNEHLKKLDIRVSDKVYDFNLMKEIILKEKREKGLDVVFLDFLQIAKTNKSGNRNLELGELTRDLKLLALQENLLIIALSQLSRNVEQRENKRPVMSDLRDSGDIESNIDSCVMLYRDEYYYPDTEYKNILEVIIRKQRQGSLGIVPMYFNYNTQKISDMIRR